MKRDGRLEVVVLAAEEALTHRILQDLVVTTTTTMRIGDQVAGIEATILTVGMITNVPQLLSHRRLTSTSEVFRS